MADTTEPPAQTPSEPCRSCGRRPACPPGNYELSSDYFRARGCGVAHIRAILPAVDRAHVRPWSAFRADVLHAVFRDLDNQPIVHAPDPDAATHKYHAGEPVSISGEADFCRLVAEYNVPVVRSVIVAAGRVLKPTLPIISIEASLQNEADRLPCPRGPVPEMCVVGGDPSVGRSSMVVFVAGNVTMDRTINSASLEKYTASEDLCESDVAALTDALRHMAKTALVARTRYGFVVTPLEVIVLSFALDDDDELGEKTVHAEWASAKWANKDPQRLMLNMAISYLAFVAILDDDRAVKKRSLTTPINGWRKVGDDYLSVVNPGQREMTLPSSGILVPVTCPAASL